MLRVPSQKKSWAAFRCAIDSFPIISLRQQAREERLSKSAVGYSSYEIRVRKNTVCFNFTAHGFPIHVDRLVLQLISHRNTPEPSSADSQTDSSHGASPSPRMESLQHAPAHNFVHVKLSLPTELWPAPIPSIHLIRNSSSHPQIIQLAPSSYTPSGLISHKSASPNNLPYLSKSMEFRSQCSLAPESTFMVYSAGQKTPIHIEAAPLMCVSSPVDRSGWLYRTELVSNFWGAMCSSQGVMDTVH